MTNYCTIRELVTLLIENQAKYSNRLVLKFGTDIEKQPTMDKNGRPHAPYDGYEHEGVVYAGGEYLPDDDWKRGYAAEITVPVSDEALFHLEANGLRPRFTVNEKYGRKFITLNTTHVEKVQIEQLVYRGPRRVLILASEAEKSGITLGRTWKFSWKRYMNSEFCEHGAEKSMDKQIVGYYYPDYTVR